MSLIVSSKRSEENPGQGILGSVVKENFSLSKVAKCLATISAGIFLSQTDSEIRNSCVLAGVTLTIAGAAVTKTGNAFTAFVVDFHDFLNEFGAG